MRVCKTGVLITFTVGVLAARLAIADPQQNAAAPAGAPIVVDGVIINGPAPPLAPDVVSRDSAGGVTIRAVRITEPLRIDGDLDESVYRSVPPIGGFIQMDPDHDAPATEKTEVWILFDNDTLYVGVRCWDSAPEKKWVANEMRRDSRTISRQNEAFHISLDTFYDRRNAFLFTITPIGGIFDGQITNEQSGANADWNPVWDRDVGRFEGGWSAEMAIPFKSLRYKPGRVQVWGINFLRLVRWKNEQSFLMPLPRNQSNAIFQVSKYGTLVGLEVPPGSKNLEIKPYAISNVTRDPVANPSSPDKLDGNIGVDVKYGLTQNLTADFTYNTDFAQVEVDEQQINLTRFNLFFPEKREFFLESAGLFEFGGTGTNVPTLFYSRQIGLNQGRPVPIEAGGRLTGKVGKFSVGLLNVQADRQASTVVPATDFSVVRLRRDILRRSNIGALYTRRSVSTLGRGSNDTAGLDATLGFFNTVNINAYVAKTNTSGLSGHDTSYRTLFNYNGDRYGAQLDRLVVGEHFNPEVGFLRRSDFKQSSGQLRFSPRPRARGRVRKYNTQVNYSYLTDGNDRLDTRVAGGGFGIDFQSGDTFDASVDRTYEFLRQPFRIARGVTIPVGGYDYQTFSTVYLFGLQRKVSGSLGFDRGSFYDGDRTALTYRTGRIELSPQLSLEPSLSINRVVLTQGRFTSNLVATRATYTMTPRMFFSGLVQYNSSSHTVNSNLRLRWEYHPGSELFVVYTDERDTGFVTAPNVENRAFAIKINRLIRF